MRSSSFWTHSRGVTGPQGEWAARAYFGDYDLAVRLPDGSTVRGTTLFEIVGPLDPKSFGTETAVECKVVSSSGPE